MQDTIEAFLRLPDVMKSLTDILKKVKDASRLLIRLQASHCASSGPRARNTASHKTEYRVSKSVLAEQSRLSSKDLRKATSDC